MNPDILYGQARPENFPHVNDYLWLFACKRFCRLLEVIDNGFDHRVRVLNYNRSIEALTLNGCICCFHRETIRSGKFFKPSDEQTIAFIFTSITGVTDVQQNIGILSKELFYDGNQSVFYMRIIPRMGVLSLLKPELICITPTKWYVFKETDTISCARISGKIKVAIVEGNLVWRLPIDIFKSNLYHTKAIFCWSSLAQRSATLRSHSCLISSECFHRRNASSCVIFLTSIMVIYLISTAKLSVFSE